eukprot:COSAG06_NODE_1027_length_11028_cov_3.385031_4_plen_239_part_00
MSSTGNNNRGEQRQNRSSFTKTGFGQTAAIDLPRWQGPLPCGSGCAASTPANGFTPLPAANVSHHYVYRASNATGGGGTYAHGPMLYHFGGLYLVSWQGAPIDEGANTGPRFPPRFLIETIVYLPRHTRDKYEENSCLNKTCRVSLRFRFVAFLFRCVFACPTGIEQRALGSSSPDGETWSEAFELFPNVSSAADSDPLTPGAKQNGRRFLLPRLVVHFPSVKEGTNIEFAKTGSGQT